MELAFLGGATTVTGSQFLLDTGDARVLVDCGMFQGSPNETVRNRLPFAYDPREVDALLLTHAHLDHCGLIPHLVASGFHGSIYATAGTNDLAGLVLLDAAKLQTEFAKRAVRRERHHHHLPRDAEAELHASGPEVTTEIDEPLYTEAARAGEAGLGRGRIGIRRALEAVEDGRHGLVDRHPRAVEDEPTGVS